MARSSPSQPLTSENYLSLHFPKAGLDTSSAASRQVKRQGSAPGKFIYTTAEAVNVRAYDRSDRFRGSSRPGLQKYVAQPVGNIAGWIVQDIGLVVGTGYDPPGGSMPASQSGRVVTIVAVSKGNVYLASPGDAAWTAATNSSSGTPPLNFTGIVYGAQNGQKYWFADGVNYRVYDPATNVVNDWVATVGALPIDGDNNTPRLIETWRGRSCLSGLVGDPQNWFFSKAGTPTDFEYGADPVVAGQAVAGNNSPAGLIGDVITAMVPYTDDVMIFGGDHTIWLLRGDPTAGGQIDLVSDSIGFAWGRAWCKGSDGAVYFLSNRTGVYQMIPGSAPVRISQAIEKRLAQIDTGTSGVRLVWDDRYQGFHMFVTPLAGPAVTTHFFYEARASAWWPDRLARPAFDPLCCCVMDGNSPTDRVPLIGSWDGYVRTFDLTAADDDGKDFASSVLIGPILTGNFDDMLLKDMQAILGLDTTTVSFDVLVGRTAEEALVSEPAYTGTWLAARSYTENIRRSGHAVYIRIRSLKPWSMESLRARFAGRGKVRGRGR